MQRTSRRAIALVVGIFASLVLAPSAQAAIDDIPDGADGTIDCNDQSGPNAGERHCSGIFTTFDGAPIDINVGFPPTPAAGPDGNFPIIGVFHGWGGSKISLTSGAMQEWLDDGYAVFSMSDRGWGNSCGAADPKRLQPVCANGYNHLMDTRFEVRDAQEVFEALADRAAAGALSDEGLIHPRRIGSTGQSYGGGISMALAALRDRQMLPDDTLVPWISEGGKQMRIAAAQPDIPWTDLAASLQPNGSTLDYVADAPYLGPQGDKRIGILKQSWVALLYGAGLALSNYAAPGTDPDADLTTWYAGVNAGEPYDPPLNPLAADIVDELTTHHSSYYIDHSSPPAPLLISNGFTDDLFPADEAIRFYNRTRAEHPATPISLIFTDHGHQRGQNKGPDGAFRSRQRHEWFDFYVKGDGGPPFQGVQTLTQTCGGPSGGATGSFDDASTDQPFRAASWAELAPGEVRFGSAAPQTILPVGGSPEAARAFDPIAGGGACATADGTNSPGAANYRLDAVPAGGFTLMGSPTVVADIFSPGPTSQVAARLLDVAPDGRATLVARGLLRPNIDAPDSTGSRLVFQLHPNGWRFEAGHVPKLELLPSDQPYGRNSNGQAPVRVSNLELRLPVLDPPGALGGVVSTPAGKIVPEGYERAPDYLAVDTDNDGWPNDSDNCPEVANADQSDEDGDGIGDACDPVDDDRDNDGVVNDSDNCPDDANPFQEDSDADGVGDACDEDGDNDGVPDSADACPTEPAMTADGCPLVPVSGGGPPPGATAPAPGATMPTPSRAAPKKCKKGRPGKRGKKRGKRVGARGKARRCKTNGKVKGKRRARAG